jgi:hypothetical protein
MVQGVASESEQMEPTKAFDLLDGGVMGGWWIISPPSSFASAGIAAQTPAEISHHDCR